VPARYDRAVEVASKSAILALVPILASLLSLSKIARVLEADPGGGMTFPFPTGLPTVWTYVSVPTSVGPGTVGGPLAVTTFVPLFLVGLVVTSALEAGFLGALSRRIDGDEFAFFDGMRRFTVRFIGVNLIRFAVVLAALPFLLIVPPLALVVVIGLSYVVYGLPFEVVVVDTSVTAALERTVGRARTGGLYARFGIAHLVAGGLASLVLTLLVRNGNFAEIIVGAILVAFPAVFVATYRVLVFRDLERRPSA
jgi:hypothetical protein